MSDPSAISDYAPDASRGEWRFLTQCIAMRLAGGKDRALAVLDPEGLNWSTIIRLAEVNRVVPLMAAAVLANQVKNVAPEAVADLGNRFRHSAHRGLFFITELRTLLASLRKAGVRCIPLKGPVLTAGSYRKLGLRDFDDLDLLVTSADVPRAVAVLAELGYSGWDIPEQWVASHLRTECEHDLISKDRSVTVDLHWAIGRNDFTMPMDFEELWHRTVRTKLIGAEVPDLSPEDTVLYLCYHGGRHLFGRLSWVCDVAATLAAHPDLDWDALVARATHMGVRRLLLLGLCLARELLRAEIPFSVREAIGRESALQPLMATVLRRIFGEANSRSATKQQIEEYLFHLRARERTFDRLRYLFWRVVPQARDWNGSRFPRSLSFFMVLKRLIRLLRRLPAHP